MRKLFLTIFLLLLIFPRTAFAETIDVFEARINIQKNGQIAVEEKISYDFGSLEKHGIFRDIPYVKTNQSGKRYRLDFSQFQVEDPFAVSSKDEGNPLWEIKIGEANKTITGKKKYNISYLVKGALSHFSNHDELYWNVTGNDWEVPILEARAVVELPEAVAQSELSLKCYTGISGSTEENCSVERLNETQVRISSLYPLGASQGMTIVVGFPKGLVEILEPVPYVTFWETPFGRLLSILIKLGFIIAVTWWYLVYPVSIVFKWFKSGRDPKAQFGTVSAWFSPPKVGKYELTPAETGTLVDERVQMKDILAMVIDLARRGYFKIEERKKNDFYFVKQKNFVSDKTLLSFEKKFLEDVFDGKREVRVKDQKLYSTFADITKSLYERVVDLKLFPKNPNSIRIFYGVIMALALMSFNLFLFIIALIFGLSMPKKTLDGALAANVARSLKNFLTSQERQLKFQSDKQLMFEKLLPFAVAFGVEKIWAKRFSNINLRPPEWYSSYQSRPFSSSVLMSDLSRSFASVTTAMTPTSSSSGFSSGFSGGSSGGGGGGGGGGSW